jgi:DNA replication protein DnaC
LWGEVGTGKTAAVLCFNDHCGGLYFSLSEFNAEAVAAMKDELYWEWSNYPEKPVTEQVFWDAIQHCGVLTLDDIGTRTDVTEAMYDRLKKALDLRDHKPLIVTSNLGEEAIAEFYDDRIASRLLSGTVVHLGGEDRRIKRRRKKA